VKPGWAFLFLALLGACAAPRDFDDADLDYRRAMEILSQTEDPIKALELLDQAIGTNPDRAEYFLARALVLHILGRVQEADLDYSAALAIRSKPPVDASGLATIYLSRGSFRAEVGRAAEGEADLSEALKLAPGNVEAYLERARIRRSLGRGQEADLDVARARELGSDMADRFYNAGVQELRQNHVDEAERFFGFGLDLKPDHVPSLVGLGRTALEKRRFATATDFLTRAIELRPGEADLYYHRANAFVALERYPEALDDFRKAVELDPTQAAFLAGRAALTQRVNRDYDQAERDFNRAIELDSHSFAAYYGRGELYHDLKLLRDAERDLRTALSIRAAPEGIRSLGQVLQERGEYDKATELYRKALEVYSDPLVQKALLEDLKRAQKSKERDR
jgi:tetratricopeptide (TPR) repeat protein